jgi:hypothetical protein
MSPMKSSSIFTPVAVRPKPELLVVVKENFWSKL